MTTWFTSSWATVGFVAASTAAIYLTTLVAVRIAGRRTVSQMSAFDVVVTIALGTLLSSTAVSPTPSYAHGVTALVTLLMLQIGVAAIRQRVPRLRRIVDFAPRVLLRDGQPQLGMSPFGPQLTHDELLSRLRQRGVLSLDDAAVVILEPNGKVSVVRAGQVPGDTSPR